MANGFVQTMADARVDAQSLSDFVFKPSGFKVARRLAPTIDTLQFYINRFNALDGDFKSSVSTAVSSLNNSVAEAEGKVAYIETTVQDAINNTAVEGGVLADTFVTVTANGVGAVPTNLRDVLSNFITVSRFGALGGGVDDTLAIQAALNAAATGMGGGTVHATDKQYTSDTVVVPDGVTFYCNLQLRTPQTILVKVNRDCKIIGKLRGLAAVGDVEKLIYPATDDCHDVYLDVDVSNTSYGVHATYITDITKAPRRWTGNIRAKNITGDGTLRGYGLLCSPAHDFDMSVSGYVIPRHTLYLTNGSSNNDITVMSDTAGYGDVQIAAYDDQNPCMNNNITIHARNMQSPVGDNSYACNLAGKVQGNTINIFIKESPNGTGAVLLRSLSNVAVCRNNTITIHQDGAMKGGAMVQSDAGVENTVSIVGIGQLTGAGAKALVNVSNYESIIPEGSYKYALHINKIDYDAMGTAMRGVSIAASYAMTDIGQGVISFNNSTDVTIKDNTGSPTKIMGWVHEAMFRSTVTVPASSAVFSTIDFTPALTLSKKLSYTVLMPTATAATMPSHVVTGFTATQVKILLKNNGTTEENFILDGVIRGY